VGTTEQRRLLTLIDTGRMLAAVWFVILAAIGWRTGRTSLLGSALIMPVMVVGFGHARRLVQRGQLQRGALATAVVQQVAALILTALLPWGYPVLAMTVLVGAASALPYLEPRALRRLLVAAGAMVAVIGVLGVSLPDADRLVPWQEGLLLVLGLVSNASLVVLLLWQFTIRQRDLLLAERASRQHEEQLSQKLSFLVDASGELNATLDEPRAERAVLELLVPRLADLGVLWMKPHDGRAGRVAVRALHPGDQAALEQLTLACPWPEDELLGGARALREQHRVVAAGPTEARIAAAARSPAHAEAMRRLAVRSAVCLPINTRRGTDGLLVLANRQLRRDIDPSQHGIIDAVVARATLALDNARLYREAVEGLQARDEFLSVAAHELRTPLTSLVLGIQAAHELAGSLRAGDAGGAVGVTAERLERALGVVEHQCRRLSELVETLLDLSRIHVGQLVLNRSRVNLLNLTREALARSAAAVLASGSHVTVTGAEQVVGQWDRVHLDQAVSNLLANALKYGQGRPVELVLSEQDGRARLEVTDHGIGIPLERQAEIFERFARAVSARQYGGLGLGLYIARRVVDAHGGTLRVASQPGQGSTFVMELPCRPPAGEVSGAG
jgi:signal transduction histidine kinase